MTSSVSWPVTPGATGSQRRHAAAIALSGSQLQYPTLMA